MAALEAALTLVSLGKIGIPQNFSQATPNVNALVAMVSNVAQPFLRAHQEESKITDQRLFYPNHTIITKEEMKLEYPFCDKFLRESGSYTEDKLAFAVCLKNAENEFLKLKPRPFTISTKRVTLESHLESITPTLKERYKTALDQASTGKDLPANITIIPHEETRVTVPNDPEFYFNASYVYEKKFIISQAPSCKSIGRFWQMIFHNQISVIVSLTETTDQFPKYWPEGKGLLIKFRDLKITSLCNSTTEDGVTTRHFLMKENGIERKVIHLEHIIPDGTGIKPLPMRRLAEKVAEGLKNEPGSRALAHCMSGSGRSGTFIACYLAIKTILRGHFPHIFHLIDLLRKDRDGLVNNKFQYLSIFEVCLEVRAYLEKVKGRTLQKEIDNKETDDNFNMVKRQKVK